MILFGGPSSLFTLYNDSRSCKEDRGWGEVKLHLIVEGESRDYSQSRNTGVRNYNVYIKFLLAVLLDFFYGGGENGTHPKCSYKDDILAISGEPHPLAGLPHTRALQAAHLNRISGFFGVRVRCRIRTRAPATAAWCANNLPSHLILNRLNRVNLAGPNRKMKIKKSSLNGKIFKIRNCFHIWVVLFDIWQ